MGQRANGARLERMRASPAWAGEGFRNLHPIAPGLRDPATPMPSIREMLWSHGSRRVPTGPLPVADPRGVWLRAPDSGLRALPHIDALVITHDHYAHLRLARATGREAA